MKVLMDLSRTRQEPYQYLKVQKVESFLIAKGVNIPNMWTTPDIDFVLKDALDRLDDHVIDSIYNLAKTLNDIDRLPNIVFHLNKYGGNNAKQKFVAGLSTPTTCLSDHTIEHIIGEIRSQDFDSQLKLLHTAISLL